MKIKKLTALIVSALMLLTTVLFVGCNKTEDIYDESGRVKVSFWFWGSPAEIEVYEELIDTYMDLNDDVVIIPTHYESNVYMNNFRNETRKPDVFFMPDTDFVQWVDGGVMLELDDYVTEAELSALWEEGVNEYYYNQDTKMLGKTSGSHFYGFPKDLGPITLAYNKTVLDKQIRSNNLNSEEVYAKLDKLSPMSWTEFIDLCKQLTADQDKSNARQIYAIPYYEWDIGMYSGGADYFDKNDPTKHGINDAFIQAITYMVQLATVHQVMPNADQSGDNAYEMFENGRTIFTWIGPWDNADFWDNTSLVYDIIPVPYNSNVEGARSVSAIGSMCYGISADSSVKDQAVKFAKWLSMSTECQTKAMYLGQQVPNIKSFASAYVSDEGDWDNSTPTVYPQSRSLFVDIMDGSSDYLGYWKAAGKTDVISGRTRSLYYTYGSTWIDNLLDYMNTQDIWKMSDAAQIRAKLEAYIPQYQRDLDQMYDDWGRR